MNSNHLDVHFFGNLLKCKYFNNSVDRSGLYLHVYILSWLAKILKFTVFRLYTKKLPHPWRDLIINAPINLSKDIWPLSTMKSFQKKVPPYFMGENYALVSLENHAGVYDSSIFARKCGLTTPFLGWTLALLSKFMFSKLKVV